MTARAPRVPTRTCVGCGQRAGQPELLRLTAGEDGLVRVDRDHAPGRGAWVHPDAACVAKAAAPRAIGRAFRGKARSPGEAALLGQAGFTAGAGEVEEARSPGRSRKLTVPTASD